MEKDMRNLKIIFASDGKGRTSPKLSIPKTWLDDMEVNTDCRTVIVEYDKEKKKITIKKAEV